MSPKIFLPLFLLIFIIATTKVYCDLQILPKLSEITKFSEIPKLSEIFGKNEKEQLKIIENKNKAELKQFQETVKNLSYFDKAIGTDARIFEWLKKWTARVDSLFKVFIYLVNLDNVPICVAEEFLNSIDKENLLRNEIAKMLKSPATNLNKRSAYIFSQEGVEVLNIDTEGVRCKASLEEPAAVGKLFYKIVEALGDEEKLGKSAKEVERKETQWMNEVNSRQHTSLFEAIESEKQLDVELEKLTLDIKIETVFNHLRQTFKNDGNHKFEFVNIVQKKISKWYTIPEKIKNIKLQFKEYAVWLFAPTNFQYLISAILYFARLSGTITIAMDAARSFGLDELIIQETQYLSNKLIDHGGDTKLVMWIFGVNGIIPLYLRGSVVKENKQQKHPKAKQHKTVEEEGIYFDHKGNEYTEKQINEWKHGKDAEDDKEFLKRIIEELIHRKGHPCETFMAHMVEKFKGLGDSAKWKIRMEKFKNGMEKFKEQVKAIDLKQTIKDVTAFLITPRHIAFLFKLILTVFGLYQPVFITLEVLEFLGITDILLEIMTVTAETFKDTKIFRGHENRSAVLDFMINENGLVPMFLTIGKAQDKDERKKRVARELQLFHLLKNVIIEHNGSALNELYKYFVEQMRTNVIGLTILQTFKADQTSKYSLRNWAKVRKAMMPMHQAKYDLDILREYAQKKIFDYRGMQERLKKFDEKIQNKINDCVPNMEDVHKLKEVRGDEQDGQKENMMDLKKGVKMAQKPPPHLMAATKGNNKTIKGRR